MAYVLASSIIAPIISKIVEKTAYLFFKIVAKLTTDPSEKEKEDEYHSLCTELVVYTAYYCGSESLDEKTLSKLKKLNSTRFFGDEKENAKKSEKITEKINEYFKVAKAINTSDIKIDINLLCNKLAKENYKYIYNYKYTLLRKTLISAAFQINKYNNYDDILFIDHIFGKMGFESWRFKDLDLYNPYSDKSKKRSTNTNPKEEKNKRGKDTESNNNQQNQKDNSFVTLTLELLVEAMKVDRSKMVCELDVIKAFILKHDKENFQKRVLEVKKYLSYEYIEVHVEEICSKIYKQFRQDYQKREDILKILVELIYADETCTNVEYNFLKKVADMLKVSKTSFDFMRMKFENRKNKNKRQNNRQENKQQSHSQSDSNQSNKNQNDSKPKYTSELEKAYAVLGIDKDASDKEIRASWRNLIRINHPDLMESKGAEAVMKATVKCQELNKAFEIVKASRGMK